MIYWTNALLLDVDSACINKIQMKHNGCARSVVSVVFDSVTLRTVACPAPESLQALQARMLEWVAMTASKRSSWPKDQTCISCVSWLKGRSFTAEPPGKPETQRERPYFQEKTGSKCFWLFWLYFLSRSAIVSHEIWFNFLLLYK